MRYQRVLGDLRVPYFIVGIGFAWLLSMVFVIFYVKTEHPLYLWDFGRYYEFYFNYGELFRRDLNAFIVQFANSVYVEDYNALPIVPLLPFDFLFERSRGGYIAAIVTCYLIPVVLFTLGVAYQITRHTENKISIEKYFSLAVFLLFVVLGHGYWAPTLRGYPDIGGLIFLAGSTVCFFSIQMQGKVKWNQTLLLGVMTMLPFVFRRWYAYSIVAFYFSAFIVSCYTVFRTTDEDGDIWQASRRLVVNYGSTVLFSCLLVLLLQRGLIIQIATTSYGDIYEAYQTGFISQLLNIYRAIGGLLIALAVAGFIVSLVNATYLKFGIFFISNLVVTWGLFIMTQAPSVQHFLPLFLWIYLLVFIFIDWLLSRLKNKLHAYAAGLLVVLVSMVNFWFMFVGGGQESFGVLPEYRYHRMEYSGDWNAYRKLQSDLQGLLSGNWEQVTVFSSNMLLSDSLLYATGSELLRGRINFASHVDKRDKFNLRTLQSKIVVVADPVQYHLRPETQQVIGVPAIMIARGTGFGAAYKPVYDAYEIAPGIKARIYKKQRPISLVEVEDFIQTYYAAYPDWKAAYTLYDFMLATMAISIGDKTGNIRLDPGNEIFMHPGEMTPTKIAFSLDKKIEFIHLRARIPRSAARHCGPVGGDVILNIFGDGTKLLAESITYQKKLTADLSVANYERLEFVVENNGSPNCDWLYLKLEPK